MFTLIKRVFRSGWQSFSRDGETTMATIFILFLAISLVTSLFLFRDVSQFVISSIQEKVDISIYFKEGIAEQTVLGVQREIAQISEVKEIEYVSQDQALQDFVERHKEDFILMESVREVGVNPFLASLNIRAWEANQYGAVSDFLEEANFGPIIEKIDFYERKAVIDKVSSFTSAIGNFGIILSVILIIVAILVTFNTIRLSIYNSRKEIKIQRLVGASNLYIRGPFLVQGAISGILASLICFLIFTVILWFLSPKISSFFPELNLFTLFKLNFWSIITLQLTTGIGAGMVSSVIAIRKYLKV